MIDIHAHISQSRKPIPPEFKDAVRAYMFNTGVDVTHYGTDEDLAKGMKENAVARACILPIADSSLESAAKVNNFIRMMMLQHSYIEGFASVDPTSDGAEREVDRVLREEGLKGLVVDPRQNFDFAGSDFWIVLEVAKALDAVIFVHSEYLSGDEYFDAEDVNETLLSFPKLRFVFSISKSKGFILPEPNVYVDTAHATKEQLESALEAFGVEKILFGSDFKYNFYPQYEISKIQQLGISEEEKDMILEGNAANILGLPFYKKSDFLDRIPFLKRFSSG
ncbi:MAG: amidohydrolase family protein [Candidatus Hydrothermarchaeales archaeon]